MQIIITLLALIVGVVIGYNAGFRNGADYARETIKIVVEKMNGAMKGGE